MKPKAPKLSTEERFMAKVDRRASGHWIWTGRTNKGYGQFNRTGAHRAAWLMFRGPIPEGVEVHHVCHVKMCVNVEHLALVTRAENLADRDANRVRKAVCKHGHPMEGDNIAWTTRSNGRTDRYCRECSRINNKAMYPKHAEARRAWANTVGAERRRQRKG